MELISTTREGKKLLLDGYAYISYCAQYLSTEEH